MMDRQDRGNWHLNSSFQVTCDWQLSQLFRCLSLCLFVFLSINSLLVKKKLQQIILPPKYNFSPRLTSLRKMCENLDPIAPGARPELALKDRLYRLWKNGHPRWWYWWRFGISREWTCTDVRKVRYLPPVMLMTMMFMTIQLASQGKESWYCGF